MKVILIAAITVDGFIGYSSDHLANWTSSEDKKVFVKITKEAGVIVLGSKTFQTIGRALPDRRNIVYTRNPKSIAVEGVETTDESPKLLVKRLSMEGHNSVAICGGATIYSLFLSAGLVTDIYLTIEPVIFGNGLGLFTERFEQKLKLVESKNLNEDTLLLHYITI